MAAFVRTILKKPHVKPLLLNCSTFGALYGAGELTQQSKAIYYDVSFFLKKTCLGIHTNFKTIFFVFFLTTIILSLA